MAHRNSIEAYYSLTPEELGQRKREIYFFIEDHPNCTYNDVCRAMTKYKTNSITARINEMVKEGWIIITGDTIDKYTLKKNRTYKAVRNPKPLSMKGKRYPLIHPKDAVLMEKAMKADYLFEDKGWSRFINDSVLYYSLIGDGYGFTIDSIRKNINFRYYGNLKLSIDNISDIRADVEHKTITIKNPMCEVTLLLK